MAKYLVLIYGDDTQWAAMSEQDRKELEAGHGAFHAAAGAAVIGGEELQPPATATTLRSTGITDGPFLETKEGLGGYYVLEAPDLDSVLALAKRLPEVGQGHAGVEIRPIREWT